MFKILIFIGAFFSVSSLAFESTKADLDQHFEISGTHSVVVYHKGQVKYQFGAVHERVLVHSIRKALLNSLFGIYVEKGQIDLSSTLAELNIDDVQNLTADEKQATIADILKSRSGVYHDSAATSEQMRSWLPPRGTYKRNEHYVYNNWDFNVAGYIFESLTKISIYDAFNRHIATPLGMKSYTNNIKTISAFEELDMSNLDGFYQYEKSRSKYPAYHFRLSAHDLALYGQLYLQNGKWQDKSIIPKNWIELSTSSYSNTNSYMDFGYGMLWNVMKVGSKRNVKAFFHTGVGIHMLAIYPEHDLVFVHRVNTESKQNFNQKDLYKGIGLVFQHVKNAD